MIKPVWLFSKLLKIELGFLSREELTNIKYHIYVQSSRIPNDKMQQRFLLWRRLMLSLAPSEVLGCLLFIFWKLWFCQHEPQKLPFNGLNEIMFYKLGFQRGNMMHSTELNEKT